MSVGRRTRDLAGKKRVWPGAIMMMLMACGGGLLSFSLAIPHSVRTPDATYNGAVANRPDVLLMKTTYCVAGPRTAQAIAELGLAVKKNDQASFDDLFANHSLLTLYPGNVIKPLKTADVDGTQFVELPQPVAGYVTCWLLGDTIP